MMNMGNTIIPKSDQLNADDLLVDGKVLKITGVKITHDKQQPVTVFYEGDNGKPYKPCLSMRRVMIKAWGVDEKEYIGRSIRVFCDETVLFGGMAVGGIRISHMSHINKKMRILLTVTRARRSEYIVNPLEAQETLPQERVQELIESGAESASRGLDAYTAWGKNLRPVERDAVSHLLKGWLKEAQESEEAFYSNE